MEMRPYWLTVENPPGFPPLGWGVGITSYSEDEARQIFAVASGHEHKISSFRVILAADEIEQNHVRPNMGNLLIRGIWFPLGFENRR